MIDVTCHQADAGLLQKLMLLMISISLLFMPQLSGADPTKCSAIGHQYNNTLRVEMESGPAVANGSNFFLGSNILYWIDDDKSWEQGLGVYLEQLHIGALRFPGGEVADNYDWETNSLEHPEKFPKEAPTSSLQDQRLDYLEFLEHAKNIGAKDLFFVVNLEGAFLAHGDIEDNLVKYANKAARWVKAVKEHGYYVKYWEIGNESYLKGSFFPLTSEEYAHAIKLFSRAMKKVDPTIKIVALGPPALNAPGFASRLTRQQLNYFRSSHGQICRGLRATACVKKIRRKIPGKSKPSAWWNVLLKDAAGDFDSVALHLYDDPQILRGGSRSLLRKTNRLKAIKDYLTVGASKPISIQITEWNVPRSSNSQMSEAGIALSNAIKLGNYLAAGVEHILFWPLQSKRNGYRALLNLADGLPTATYRAFRLLVPVWASAFVTQKAPAESLYVLQTHGQGGDQVMIVNLGRIGREIALDFSNLRSSMDVFASQLSGDRMTGGELCRERHVQGEILMRLPSGSLTMVRLM